MNVNDSSQFNIPLWNSMASPIKALEVNSSRSLNMNGQLLYLTDLSEREKVISIDCRGSIKKKIQNDFCIELRAAHIGEARWAMNIRQFTSNTEFSKTDS